MRTGALQWIFHTVPRPGEFGADTWPEAGIGNYGGVHNWSESTVDTELGIVYIPTGTARYDFYGGNREGENLFGNSLLALDARTGKRLWHFQTIHHDFWDYDLPTAPKLMTVMHDGLTIPAIAQPSKQGFVYVFNRITGEPLWPIEERPVPQSDMPGEMSWPTQPFPTAPPPFARQSFTEADINPHISAEDQAKVREILRAPQRRPVHAAEPARHDHDAGPQRRRELGWLGRRSQERPAVRGFERAADDGEPACTATAGARWPGTGGARRRTACGAIARRRCRRRMRARTSSPTRRPSTS